MQHTGPHTTPSHSKQNAGSVWHAATSVSPLPWPTVESVVHDLHSDIPRTRFSNGEIGGFSTIGTLVSRAKHLPGLQSGRQQPQHGSSDPSCTSTGRGPSACLPGVSRADTHTHAHTRTHKSSFPPPKPYLVLRNTLCSCEAYGMRPMYKEEQNQHPAVPKLPTPPPNLKSKRRKRDQATGVL
jgi:hypothetical protein